ncbi:MAG: OadG family protein [Spirochaetales bacterium]|nr:OadG family protein [Spirochaetales bacterium]
MYALAQLSSEVLLAQLKNGLFLLVMGMAIVFVFLTILVFTTKGVSKIVRKFEKKVPAAAQNAPQASAAPAGSSDDAEVAVAIAAALAKSRS